MNLYCNSIIALDAATGKMKWYHQLVHHDTFDSDMPTPPLLVNVRTGRAHHSCRRPDRQDELRLHLRSRDG